MNTKCLPVESRIAAKSKQMENGCIVWTGSYNGRNGTGYAVMSIMGKKTTLHRYLYEQKHGPIPANLELDHLCRNKLCINVNHLEAVTHAENMLRAVPFTRNAGKLKTHCPHGHKYDQANTRWRKNRRDGRRTFRICIECSRANYRKYYHTVRKFSARAILTETEAKV